MYGFHIKLRAREENRGGASERILQPSCRGSSLKLMPSPLRRAGPVMLKAAAGMPNSVNSLVRQSVPTVFTLNTDSCIMILQMDRSGFPT